MILVSREKIDAATAQGWWGERTLWQVFSRWADERGTAEAVVDAPNRSEFANGTPQRWSWERLRTEADRLAAALLDVGLQRDDVLVVQLPNMVEQFAVYLACARLGIIVSPVPVQYRAHELNHILAMTQATAAITLGRIGKTHEAARMFVELADRHPSIRSVLAWGDDLPEGVIDLQHAPAHSAQLEARLATAEATAGVTANDVFTICWTSGTESRPKGVPRSHNQWLIAGPDIIYAAELSGHARLLNPFPMVNMAGIATGFVTLLTTGGTTVQHHPFQLPVFLQQLRDETVHYTLAPPALLNTLLQNEHLLEGIDFTVLRRIGSGSAPLSDWMIQGFAERFGVQIVNYFGSNEGAALTATFADVPDPSIRATCFPRIGVDGLEWEAPMSRRVRTRLVDLESGQDIDQPGIPGELRFDGPAVFSGYWKDEDATRNAFDDTGFYRTGDLFEIVGDQGQYYRFLGRCKDLVVRGGMKISAEEIENLLVSCPGVVEAAVVGVPDAILGEKLCACVSVKPGTELDLKTLTRHLQEECQVAVFKLPEYLLVLDTLPRNPVGKLDKKGLRARAAQLGEQT